MFNTNFSFTFVQLKCELQLSATIVILRLGNYLELGDNNEISWDDDVRRPDADGRRKPLMVSRVRIPLPPKRRSVFPLDIRSSNLDVSWCQYCLRRSHSIIYRQQLLCLIIMSKVFQLCDKQGVCLYTKAKTPLDIV